MGVHASKEKGPSMLHEDDTDELYGKVAVRANSLHCCHEVYPRLYVGALDSVCHPINLVTNKITHVVSCLPPYILDTVKKNVVTAEEKAAVGNIEFNWLALNFEDQPGVYLDPYIDQANIFIQDALSNSEARVLIHCIDGTGRSGCIAIGYLIYCQKFKAREALLHVQRIRHVINPSRGFRRQLLNVEFKCNRAVDPDGPMECEDDVDAIYGRQAVNDSIGCSCHEVYPRLFVGSLDSVCDPSELVRHGITHVVSCLQIGIKDVMIKNAKTDEEKAVTERLKDCWLCLDFPDTPVTDILTCIEKSIPFIINAHKDPKSKVLVHCMAGASRSASIAVAYIMHKKRISAKKALLKAQAIRPIINPNVGFRRQLLELQDTYKI